METLNRGVAFFRADGHLPDQKNIEAKTNKKKEKKERKKRMKSKKVERKKEKKEGKRIKKIFFCPTKALVVQRLC